MNNILGSQTTEFVRMGRVSLILLRTYLNTSYGSSVASGVWVLVLEATVVEELFPGPSEGVTGEFNGVGTFLYESVYLRYKEYQVVCLVSSALTT